MNVVLQSLEHLEEQKFMSILSTQSTAVRNGQEKGTGNEEEFHAMAMKERYKKKIQKERYKKKIQKEDTKRRYKSFLSNAFQNSVTS